MPDLVSAAVASSAIVHSPWNDGALTV